MLSRSPTCNRWLKVRGRCPPKVQLCLRTWQAKLFDAIFNGEPPSGMANNSDNSDNYTQLTSIQNQVREHNCLLENSWLYQLFLIWFNNIIIMIRTCLIPAMNCPIEGPITHRLRLSLALNIGCVCVVWKLVKSGQATKRAPIMRWQIKQHNVSLSVHLVKK